MGRRKVKRAGSNKLPNFSGRAEKLRSADIFTVHTVFIDVSILTGENTRFYNFLNFKLTIFQSKVKTGIRKIY